MSETEIPAPSWKKKRHPVRHWILFLMRVVLGGAFVFAAWNKMFAPFNFYMAILKFQMLPVSWVWFAAIALIWSEMICGTFMLLGLWTRAATTLMSGMLAIFLVGIVSAVVRGLDITCGCFGVHSDAAVGWTTILRILLLLVSALLLLYYGSWRWSLDLVIKVHRRVKAGLPGWR